MSAGADCPLCGASATGPVHLAHGRRFHDCPGCRLVFADRTELLPPAEERARYETHENDPADPGYRAFLDRLAGPLTERLAPGAHGLDFGSGPGPTLSRMLTERGYPTADWDPFFSPDPAPLERTWDFVTCTEVVEHLHHPAETFELLSHLVRPGGWLAVMTTVLTDDLDFGEWWYARDPTHVAFYRPETLEWIAERYGWALERPSGNVALFRVVGRGG